MGREYISNGLTDRHELQFVRMKHIDPLDPYAPNILKFQKPKMAAAAILKNPTRPKVLSSCQTAVDTSIYCIKVESKVGYCEFVYPISAIFLLPISV